MKITVELEEYEFSKLSEQDQKFLNEAKLATDEAYAPYSEFYVGCVVSLEDGDIVHGSNQENASFPSGLCAERVALFQCSKKLENKVKRIAVFARSEKYKVPTPLVPCAACLQVIADIRSRQKAPIEIWLWDGSELVHKAKDVYEFLPFHFELEEV
ncbi:MAG: cytidine deaminase [Arcticibacterium sp.]|jgi:cytidine deaminase